MFASRLKPSWLNHRLITCIKSESTIISPSIHESKIKPAQSLKKWKTPGLNIYTKSFLKYGKRLKATIKKERKIIITEVTQKKDCDKSLGKIIKKLTKEIHQFLL
jgi:hypothetical protein